MKVVFSPDFYQIYTSDPAAGRGRMESIMEEISHLVEVVEPKPATEEEIARVHTAEHIAWVKQRGIYDIAALAAGGAITAARIGLSEPCFGVIRPPGHHASADSAWGFCYFNNMAVALTTLKAEDAIHSAFVLDFDLHYGDGTVNILRDKHWVRILNPSTRERQVYRWQVREALEECRADLIGVSAGFDYHAEDWGGLLETEDYQEMGWMAAQAARRNQGGCFGILEGGYNHAVLGKNVLAFMRGMEEEAAAAIG